MTSPVTAESAHTELQSLGLGWSSPHWQRHLLPQSVRWMEPKAQQRCHPYRLYPSAGLHLHHTPPENTQSLISQHLLGDSEDNVDNLDGHLLDSLQMLPAFTQQ